MKHIGWCLDQIQIVMATMPKTVLSRQNTAKAKVILSEVQKYTNTLEQLIQNPNFKSSLHQLENSSIEGVKLQAHEVERLFDDLKHLLLVLDLYLQQLWQILIAHPEQWGQKADQLVLMIDQKFGGEMGELRQEFKVALYQLEELRKIVTSKEHLAEFLKL
ncbi:TPA: hypothetical protein HA241_07590 [Candidatus Woesearchaeota archaeon]|nr:hypothetical protein [Candidatus Woesearchaeota archaeon]